MIEIMKKTKQELSATQQMKMTVRAKSNKTYVDCSGDFCHQVVDDGFDATTTAFIGSKYPDPIKNWKKSSGPGGVQLMMSQRKSIKNGSNDSSSGSPEYTISYSSIVLMRQEKKQAEAFLRSYSMVKNSAEYTLNRHTLALSEDVGRNFPGHYYKTVKVCWNCYKIYRLLEEFRIKTLAKTRRKTSSSGSSGIANKRLPSSSHPALAKSSYHDESASSSITKTASRKNKTAQNRKIFRPVPTVQGQQQMVNKLTNNNTEYETSRILLCSDGITRIPYEVIGRPSSSSDNICFVVCHDVFDTIDMTKLLFVDVVRCHHGCQVLLFNQPGQAGSTFPRRILDGKMRKGLATGTEEGGVGVEKVINNDFIATCLHDLLTHVYLTGELPITTKPFHLVGMGNGLSVCLSWLNSFHKSELPFKNSLASIVAVNGFVTMDQQLTSIFHSSLNVFRCCPVDRPDLPISYFSQYLFSKRYISNVSRELALNIYTAIINPITLEGRLRLCSGALRNSNMEDVLRNLSIPLVSVQSTQSELFSSSLEAIMRENNCSVIDSAHYQGKTGISFYRPEDIEVMNKALLSSGCTIIKVHAGHTLYQECKKSLTDLFDILARPSEPFVLQAFSAMESHLDCLELKLNPNPLSVTSNDVANNSKNILRNDGATTKEPSESSVVDKKAPVKKCDKDHCPFIDTPKAELFDESIFRSYSGNKSPSGSNYYPDEFDTYDTSKYTTIGLPMTVVSTFASDKPPTDEKGTREVSTLISEASYKKWNQLKSSHLVPTVDELLQEANTELENEIKREKQNNEVLLRSSVSRYEMHQSFLERIKQSQKDRIDSLTTGNATIIAEMKRKNVQINNAIREAKIQVDDAESNLVEKGVVQCYKSGSSQYVREIPNKIYNPPGRQRPSTVGRVKAAVLLDNLEKDAQSAKKHGIMRVEDFEAVKKRMAQQQLERDEMMRSMEDSKKLELLTLTSIVIQKYCRGLNARLRVQRIKQGIKEAEKLSKASVIIGKSVRVLLAKKRVKQMKEDEILKLVYGASVLVIQKLRRGYLGRQRVNNMRRLLAIKIIQRVSRGFLGRKLTASIGEQRALYKLRGASALVIQCSWRVKAASNKYISLRVSHVAAVEIQRYVRGILSRKKTEYLRRWSSASPGAERLKLGLERIEESKEEFEKQRETIDILHVAQEKAEERVNSIYKELKESEKQLKFLEKELNDIESDEDYFNEFRSQNHMSQRAPDISFSGQTQYDQEEVNSEKEDGTCSDIHTLKIQFDVAKAERRKKRQILESELAGVFKETEEKRSLLKQIEGDIAEMDATRQRKDREFARLQKSLMELLHAQKLELDQLRAKGIELETATAASAVAAAETARRAREHEQETNDMFNKHEELMKFQFMSMSLSYFSSLNMLKQMRTMNHETTNAAVTNSADTAAAAAAAAAAANMPSGKLTVRENKVENISSKDSSTEANDNENRDTSEISLPSNIISWKIYQVSQWLDKLSLSMYKEAFKEAAVDGEFLLELTEEDLATVLGVEHQLHRRKILSSRDKLAPQNKEEAKLKEELAIEEKADETRRQIDVSLDVVFSQARHGRLRRLEESLDSGFDVNSEDEFGNTLLMIAVQNKHRKMTDTLLNRGALLNRVNAQGNSALHFAFAYDTTGQIAESLIEQGADDTVENLLGMTPYDGIGDVID